MEVLEIGSPSSFESQKSSVYFQGQDPRFSIPCASVVVNSCMTAIVQWILKLGLGKPSNCESVRCLDVTSLMMMIIDSSRLMG